MEPIIYLVSTGSYSDYSIVGAFSTREKAEAFVAVCEGSRIEEVPIDNMPTDGRTPWMVWTQRGVLDIGHASRREWGSLIDVGQVTVIYGHLSYEERPIAERAMSVDVMAHDEQHAIKIAADRFREHFAVHGYRNPQVTTSDRPS
jgi:hypothetical protein